ERAIDTERVRNSDLCVARVGFVWQAERLDAARSIIVLATEQIIGEADQDVDPMASEAQIRALHRDLGRAVIRPFRDRRRCGGFRAFTAEPEYADRRRPHAAEPGGLE